jgi:hypothetical protein
MHQAKKGNQWYFGMKAHIGVDAAPGLVHTVVGTAANVSDINVAGALLHSEEHAAFGDSGSGRAQTTGARRTDLARGDASGQAQAAESVHRARVRGRAGGEDEGQHLSQGRAPVPSDQAAVRVWQGSLSRLAEEHGTDRHAVRAVEPVDGAQAADAGRGDECALQRPNRARQTRLMQQIDAQTARSKHLLRSPSPYSFSRDRKSRSADHPWSIGRR